MRDEQTSSRRDEHLADGAGERGGIANAARPERLEGAHHAQHGSSETNHWGDHADQVQVIDRVFIEAISLAITSSIDFSVISFPWPSMLRPALTTLVKKQAFERQV